MKSITISEDRLTERQIITIQDYLNTALRKENFQNEAVQLALEKNEQAVIAEIIAVVRKYEDMHKNVMIHQTEVNRSLRPIDALKATGRCLYIKSDLVKSMPNGNGSEVDVVFFKIGCYISDIDLEKEYEQRGLIPADPFSLAKINENNSSFADRHPNGTHWKDINGNWCFIAFDRWRIGRRLRVYLHECNWGTDWWFAGLINNN